MELLLIGISCLSTVIIVMLGISMRKSIKGSLDTVSLNQNSVNETIEKGFKEIKEWGHLLQSELRRSQEDFKLNTVTQLTSDFHESNQKLLEKINEKFNEFQRTQITGLDDSRKLQDNRLKAVETTLRESSDTSLQAAAKHQKELMTQAKSQSEEITTALAGFQDKLTGSLTKLSEQQNQFSVDLLKEASSQKEGVLASTKKQSENLNSALSALKEQQTQSLKDLTDALVKSQSDARIELKNSLDDMRKDNETKLEKIRVTVEEKLQSVLEKRLSESFSNVQKQLEAVHKGLGEMQSLASGVGDLKKVLTNIRNRGTFGEVRLAALLEQLLTPEQYDKNCETIPGSGRRVEFAIRLPKNPDSNEIVYLPIDAKYPQERFEKLLDACEKGDTGEIEIAQKQLSIELTNEAKTIREKYIKIPHTTDFALMFLPTEGLYAEALRLSGLPERLLQEHHIVIVGPMTLSAILNSLQLGFRTLAIEKRSGEVWRVLGAVKSEFGKFGETLKAVSKKLQEAQNKIDDSTKRSKAVARKLEEVETLPQAEAAKILPEASLTISEDVDDSE